MIMPTVAEKRLFEDDISSRSSDINSFFEQEIANTSGLDIDPEWGTGRYRPNLRYGGAAPGTTEDESFFGGLFKYWKKKFRDEPLIRFKGFGGHFGKAVRGGIGSGILFSLAPKKPKNAFERMAKTYLESRAINKRENAQNEVKEMFPGLRTYLAYAAGKTSIDKMYVYNTGSRLVPIFFTTYKEPKDPDIAELKKLMADVDATGDSPFDTMESGVSEKYLDNDFIRYAADSYTGNAYSDYFKNEPARTNRWFVKEETKMKWNRDVKEEAKLDPSLAGKMHVYRRPVSRSGFWYQLGRHMKVDDGGGKPRSGKMFWDNWVGNVCQDITYWGTLTAFAAAAITKTVGKGNDDVRVMVQENYKRGSELTEAFTGQRKWLSYHN